MTLEKFLELALLAECLEADLFFLWFVWKTFLPVISCKCLYLSLAASLVFKKEGLGMSI